MSTSFRLLAAIGLVLALAPSARGQLPEGWRVDAGLYPKAYGVLADERLMHPVDVSAWPVKIDSRRQLFVDDELIASVQGLTRTINPVRKHPRNPLIVPDQPWEGARCVFPFVLRDEEGRFRMWYTGTPTFTGADGRRHEWVGCYAESKDGVHWEKPALGLHELQGSRENNVVLAEGGVFGLMLTPDDDPERRFKALVLRFQNQPDEGYWLYTSPDGLKWTQASDRLLPAQQGYRLPIPGLGDTSQFRWDPRLGKYVGDVKFVLPGKMRVRGIMESDDLVHWTRPRMTLYPDALDDPKAQIYGHSGFVYESQWIGLARIMHDDFVPDSYKQTTIELTSSHDGRHWRRVGDRAQFIPLGRPDEWDPHYHDPACGPVQVGDELWFYYRSTPLWKDMHDKLSRIGLATLRRDGFVSLDAGDEAGTVVTRPLTFSGVKLFVNAHVSEGGHLKAELREADGSPVAGYTFDACAAVTGDAIEGRIAWTGHDSIARREPRSLRVAFQAKRTKLYSFWID